MKTLKQLKREVERHGGTFAEDMPFRNMRNIQLEAPAGKMWVDGMVHSIKVVWARGSKPGDVLFNCGEFDFAVERMDCGLVDDPDTEPAQE
jgi:hypothetical protein